MTELLQAINHATNYAGLAFFTLMTTAALVGIFIVGWIEEGKRPSR